MPADFGLPAFGIAASYLLRVFAAGLAVCLLARLSTRANLRFALWLSYLAGAGAYWIFLLIECRQLGAASATTAAAASAALPSHLAAAWSVSSRSASGITMAMRLALGAYLLGAAILLGHLVRRRMRLYRLIFQAVPVTGNFARDFEYLGRSLGVRQCSLWTLQGLESPATVFSFRPRVLLPASIKRLLDDEQLNDVLCHELVHVRRRDYAWGLLAELIRCLVFFHPCVWLAITRLRRERELACDAAVVRQRSHRTPAYAQCLTRMARLRLGQPESALSTNLLAAESLLRLRVRSLLAQTARVPLWKRSAAFAGGAGVLAALVLAWPLLAVVLLTMPAPLGANAAADETVSRPAASLSPAAARRNPSWARRPGKGLSLAAAAAPEPTQPVNLPPPPHLTLEAANAELSGALGALQGAVDNPAAGSRADASPLENQDADRGAAQVWSGAKTPGASKAKPDWSRIAVGVAIALGRAAADGAASDAGGGQTGNN